MAGHPQPRLSVEEYLGMERASEVREHYRTLDSLTDSLLVTQAEAKIEHFTRQESGWLLIEARGPDGVLPLPSIGCELRLAEVYERVKVD